MRQVAVWLVVGVVLTACGIEGEQLFGDAAAGGSDAATSASASGSTAVAATTGQGGASTENGVGGAFTVSGVNSSIVSSSSASTGGMNETLCLPKDNDSKCSKCIKGTCCAELDACAGDVACAGVLACTVAQQQSCYSKCNTNWNQPAWSSLVNCRTLKCGFDCIGQ